MRRNFRDTLNKLVEIAPDVPKFRDGKPNVTAIARAVGVNQSTFKRWMDGNSVDPEGENADKLCRYFKVTRDQLTGKAPIPKIDGPAAHPERIQGHTVKDTLQDLARQDQATQQLFVSLYWQIKEWGGSASVPVISGEVKGSFTPPRTKR